jgi:E3 ubiquitin-protein ligase ZNF598
MSLTEAIMEPRSPTDLSTVPLTELYSQESVGDHQHCLVCYSNLSHPGIQPCNHNEICGACHLRLRHLHSNKRCPICKEEHDKIIVDVPGKQFDEYPMWGDELGSNYVFRKNVGIFFEQAHYADTIEPLFGYQCSQPGCSYDGTVPDDYICPPAQAQDVELEGAQNGGGGGDEGNFGHNDDKKKIQKNKKTTSPLRALQDHLRIKHRMTLCQLCIDHKRDFVARLPRFAPHQLKRHLTKGEPGSGFEGHPVCEFCRPKRFYDLSHLHMHLQKEHYKCHVCEKQGKHNQFFRNYQSLEKHFDKVHFLCHDVQCMQARFVVFENEIDLHAHERQVHGGTSSGSSKIQLEFRIRRVGYDDATTQRQDVPSEEDFNFGLQGEAFVPAALPQIDGPTLHPLHLQRTAEFRAHAAQIREQQDLENQGESFPTLQAAQAGTGSEAGAGLQPLNIGWTSATTVQRLAPRNVNAGTVTEMDFPALPSSGPPKSTASAKLRAPANRQFAVIRSTATPSVLGGGWGTSVARPTAATSYQQHNGAAFAPAHSESISLNRTENLTQDNFPALGGGRKAPRYAAASSLAKKQPAPSWNSAVDFPVPSTANANSAPKLGFAAAPKPAPKQTPPSLNSEEHFPPPPSASNNHKSVKERMLGNQKQPSRTAMDNVLPPSYASLRAVDPKDTLRDMQTSLGPVKYKSLKNVTRHFANDDLTPDAFISHAASLFEKGYGDPEFWKGIPALVASCPNQKSANEALRYMESIRTDLKTTPTPTPNLTAPRAPPSNSWGGAPPDLTPESFPPPSASLARPAASSGWGGGPSIAASTRPIGTTRYVVPGVKNTNAWGGGTVPSSVTRSKKPGPVASVAAAAANEGPLGGTATKFMAQQTKQQKQQAQQKQQNASGNKKNKKKEKDDLRNLAFGK